MIHTENDFERSKLRRYSTMKCPEKPGFLKRAREKISVLSNQTNIRHLSSDSSLPSMKVHLPLSNTISQPQGDE